jgi:hypothetical protein
VAETRRQFAVLRPTQERVQGREHPDSLTMRHELVRWTAQGGCGRSPRPVRGLLHIEERVQAREHREI